MRTGTSSQSRVDQHGRLCHSGGLCARSLEATSLQNLSGTFHSMTPTIGVSQRSLLLTPSFPVSDCITIYYVTLYHVILHCVITYCLTLHYSTLHYITSHYILGFWGTSQSLKNLLQPSVDCPCMAVIQVPRFRFELYYGSLY